MDLTAGDILALRKPEDLYPGDIEKARHLYRTLSQRWHPDKSGGNEVVFARLAGLYHEAIDRLNRGVWEGSAVLTFPCTNGTTQRFAIRASSPFELGQSLVGDDHASYLIDTQHAAFVHHATKWPKGFRFVNPRMEEEFTKYLPQHVVYHSLSDGRHLVRMQKTPDLIRLRDIVTHIGALDPKHIAWIVSSLLNLACYLSYADIVHQDISPDTVFISPNTHNVALLGGWWYATRRGVKMTTVPRRTFDLLPFKAKISKLASSQTDLELIRATARECLPPGLTHPVARWLQEVSRGRAVEQYESWVKMLGERKFTKLSLNADIVYGSRGVS
jgi:hypothetical protein